ncbi:MAG: GNAT family N-acetyltransferase [Acidobacteriota bacterium]
MVIRPLTAKDFDAVYRGFVEAFSDYVVPLAPSPGQLREMLTRRGWIPEVSVGAFEGERMVAFTLNALEGERGYDSGTGVVPAYRRQGMARELMERSFTLLQERGARQYVLEVIDDNTRAAALYLALGFVESRGLQCWRHEWRVAGGRGQAGEVPEPAQPLSVWASWRDVTPSWQNSDASLARAEDPHVVLGHSDGYAVVFPSTGDLTQLAVRREARRTGVGTRLLQAAEAVAGKPLRIMNVDDGNPGIARFLEQSGAIRTVHQLEMIRPLP